MSDTNTTLNPETQKKASENTFSFSIKKGGEFLVSETNPNDIFTSEEFGEEALMMSETARDFCTKEIWEPFLKNGKELEVTNRADRDKIVAILRRAGELGLASVSIPEEYEGMGLDFKTNTLISKALSSGFSFATVIGAHTSIGCLPIVYYGTEAQKQQYLPKLASTELIGSYALTEPGAGSDANAGKTSATLSDDGKYYLLNGQKMWITNGGIADLSIVFAKIDDDKNLSAFIVEKDFEGYTIGEEEKKFSIKGSSTTQLFFDNCKVPVENLLGERQGGFKLALTILNGGRIKAGAAGLGGAEFALELATKYAKERKQFGKSISDFGVIKAKLANMAVQIFAAEAALFRTVDMVDKKETALKAQGLTKSEAIIQATTEFAPEASIVKVKGSDIACYAIDEAMQIYGGMGLSVETGLGMGYRDARITRIFEGTNEINSMLAVGELSKRALKKKDPDLFAAGKKIPAFLLSRINPFRSKTESAEQRRILAGLKNTFIYLLGVTGQKFKKEMIDEQEIIMHLSNILQETYLAESAFLKYKKMENNPNFDKEKLAYFKNLATLSLYEALEKSKQFASEAIDSFATGSKRKRHNRIVGIMLKSYRVNPKKLRRDIADYLIKKV